MLTTRRPLYAYMNSRDKVLRRCSRKEVAIVACPCALKATNEGGAIICDNCAVLARHLLRSAPCTTRVVINRYHDLRVVAYMLRCYHVCIVFVCYSHCGARAGFKLGANNQSEPPRALCIARASRPMAEPIALHSVGSNDAPSAAGHGNDVGQPVVPAVALGGRQPVATPCNASPDGIPGTPSLDTGGTEESSAAAFSSGVMRATRSSMRAASGADVLQ